MGLCSALSSCETVKAIIECLPTIHQGADYQFTITLLDEDDKPLDLDQFSGIYMCLFGDDISCIYANYSTAELTDTEPIDIIQQTVITTDNSTDTDTDGTTEEIINKGQISFKISSDMSKNFLSGNLSAEIKLREEDTNWPNGYKFKVISCLKIGKVKQSKTRDITDF